LFEHVTTLIPQLETTVLDTTDRRRLNGSGVRRYGFIDKVSDVSVDFPQFWPSFAENGDELKEMMRKIEVLRNLLVWFRYASRVVQDILLMTGDEAFRLAGSYYATVRDSAQRKIPEAMQVFDLLQMFWKNRRKASAEPTERQTMRNIKGLLRGTREGEMFLENESDSVTKGKRTIVDKTRRKQRNNFKEVETGKVEDSEE